ncbi:MAG: DUF1284 domain-containing protein [Nitrospiraceae bacterium]|nr:DUF1284 domain-containing protein [Nitrospiraceae bacterium]
MAEFLPNDVVSLTVYPDQDTPLRLRGHTLLCLQGFRGEGYSVEFVKNLAGIHRRLAEHPEQWIEVIQAPDAVCAACPHRAPAGCTLKHEHSEAEMQMQDRHVMSLLDLQAGTIIRWRDVLKRIRAVLNGESLLSICGQCRWLPLGYCREGINRLKATNRPLPPPVIAVADLRSSRSPSS